MTMDQYKDQYNRETEQIHAPADLVARTKAAMQEEEARIGREFTVQAAGPEMKGRSQTSGPAAVPAGDRSYAKGFNVRKWAYPLTAAAALLVLVSVSMMMRGLKSGDTSMSGAPAEDMAMETEGAEMSGGGALDGGMAAGAAETVEEASAVEMASAETDMAAAPAYADEIEDMPEPAAAESAVSDTAGVLGDLNDAIAEDSESSETQWGGPQRKLENAEKSRDRAETPTDNGLRRGAAAEENITIEKVTKKPDFCGHAATETLVFEGETFQIAEEEDGWAAYVETRDGSRYVIRGEAEDLETFLEMGYRKLTEQE